MKPRAGAQALAATSSAFVHSAFAASAGDGHAGNVVTQACPVFTSPCLCKHSPVER